MVNTIIDFEIRKTEITIYFSFLKILDVTETTRLKFKKDGNIVEEEIPEKLHEILLANGYLILYNLIESTVKNSIIEIYEEIKIESVTYEKLSENLKKIWINQEIDNLKEGNFSVDTMRNYVFSLAEKILNEETMLLSEEKMDFSGNLDAQKIRALADKIGFEISQNGRNLVKIKDKRNRLAHGEQTFYDVGKNCTVNELIDFKDETFNYLSDVIDKIELFITDKKYTTN